MSAPSPAPPENFWGNYAGSASRLLAFGADLAVSTVVFELALAAIGFVVGIVSGHSFSVGNLHSSGPAVLVIYILWEFVYFGYSWAASGRTPGMALLGICVVRDDGEILDTWRGWVRAITFPLGFLTLGIGFLWIFVDRERRAVYDLIAGSTVVYAWEARTSRMRFLSRPAALHSGGSPPSASQLTPPTPQFTSPSSSPRSRSSR